MLSYVDCLGLSELDENDVETLSLDSHLPAIVALEYGNYVMQLPNGATALSQHLQQRLTCTRRNCRRAKQLETMIEHLHHYHRTSTRPRAL